MKKKIRPLKIKLKYILVILWKLCKFILYSITWSNTVRRLQEGQLHGAVYISSVYCIHKSYSLSPGVYDYTPNRLSFPLSHDTPTVSMVHTYTCIMHILSFKP